MKTLRHYLEYGFLAFIFRGLGALPLDLASFIGSTTARTIGPLLKAHKVALKNLEDCLPDLTPRQRRLIARDMWDNLGRTGAELPHLNGRTIQKRITVTGLEHLPQGQVVFVSAHLGNWELNYLTAHMRGIPLTLVYRRINNPLVEELIASIRRPLCADLIPKGPKNAFRLMRTLKNKQSLAMLIDQKMNDGISVPFFGRPAMTANAPAELALKFGLPIVPVRVVRTRGAHFKFTVYPPLKPGADAQTIMTSLNSMVEAWIRETPDQWFWVHRRWGKQS